MICRHTHPPCDDCRRAAIADHPDNNVALAAEAARDEYKKAFSETIGGALQARIASTEAALTALRADVGPALVTAPEDESGERGRTSCSLCHETLDEPHSWETCARASWAYAMKMLDLAQERDTETVALRADAQALVDALPRCDQCERPATRAYCRGAARYCDTHGGGELYAVPEYPRAAPLRVLVARLARGET